MKIIFTLLLFCIIFAGILFPQERDPRDVAMKSLETFKQLVTEENYSAMGFSSKDEISKAQLGEPLKIYIVRLDQLQKYNENTNPNELLTEQQKYIYPVTVNGDTKSSLSVARFNDEWKSSSFGSPNYIMMLAKFRSNNSFVVNVLALNLSFIGTREDNKLMLTPIMDYPTFDFKAGQTMPAEDVFKRILPEAREHDGLPR